jgi:hypothetical protein
MRAALFVFLAACAPRLQAGFEIEGGDFSMSNVATSVDDSGVAITQIQAIDKVAWIYFDFETNAEVGVDSGVWDLGFRRFEIRLADGAISLGEVPFDDVNAVSRETVFEQDTPNPVGGEPEFFFNKGDGWYFYDLSNHTLTSRKHVYVVRSIEGALYKMEMIAYYDSLGSSGYPAFKWQKLP